MAQKDSAMPDLSSLSVSPLDDAWLEARDLLIRILRRGGMSPARVAAIRRELEEHRSQREDFSHVLTLVGSYLPPVIL